MFLAACPLALEWFMLPLARFGDTDAGRMKAAPLHHFSSQPKAVPVLGDASHIGHTAWQGKIFPLFLSSCVTFLLPKKLHVPSGQVIKLEDQQYMKKEQDQFTEKCLKAVYYIFYLFFAGRSFAKSLKGRIE